MESMRGTRQQFVAAAGIIGAGLLTPAIASAQESSPSPSATPSPSPAAQSFAERMKAFDPQLTDDELATIAKGIDDGYKAGASLRKARALRNGDGPTPEFEAGA
jgi:hypothetical protein